jgi:hypothetical protein
MNAKDDHKGICLYSDIDEMMMIMVDQRCVRWCLKDDILIWVLMEMVLITSYEYRIFERNSFELAFKIFENSKIIVEFTKLYLHNNA